MSTNENVLRKPKLDISNLTFERLSRDFGAGVFCCGVQVIDNWFERRAFADHRDLLCRVVTAHLPEIERPVGFYSMCLAAEVQSQFSDYGLLKRVRYFFTNSHMLVCKLEWVAVDLDYQKQGIGRLLMGRAIKDFAEVADRTGVFALTLKAIDNQVQQFYAKLGFENYGSEELRKMILPALSVIEARQSTATASPSAATLPA